MGKTHQDKLYVGHEPGFDKAWEAFKARMRKDKKMFEKKDFKCPHCGKVKADNGFLKKLNKLLDKIDVTVDKTKCSAYRCKTYNAAKGGSKNSAHIYGKAIDIPMKSAREKRKTVDVAVDIGFQGIGVYNGHIHIDDRERWHKTPVIWSGVSK